MKIPEEISPYCLIQEILRDDPWKLLVAVICLNMTSAKQAIPVLEKIFKTADTPELLLALDGDQLESILKPLGLHRRRSKTLVEMSKAFLGGFSDLIELPGIGKYGADSYNMFISGDLVDDVTDKELRNYVNWVKESFS